MNFAPYQSSPPETTRALSPPRRSTTVSPTKQQKQQPRQNAGYQDLEASHRRENDPFLDQSTGRGTDVYQTSLGFRMEIEAALAYVLFPPAGGFILLLFEWKSDYVRFHAWQSALLFTCALFLHLLFSWTTLVSWLLFVCDLGLIGFLAWHAYNDAETLDRLELPLVGRLASSFVDGD